MEVENDLMTLARSPVMIHYMHDQGIAMLQHAMEA